ncbi:MAG: transglycosylase SLT domain-containing protein [bacterium]
MLTLLVVCCAGAVFGQRSANRYDDYFRAYSKRYFGVGYDWRIFKAQAMAESNLDSAAKSWVGAMGLMQLMPNTYKEIQSENPELREINEPRWNIAAGIMYNRKLWKSWKEILDTDHRLSFMFGSYNAGRGTISRAQDRAKEEQLNYMAWESIESIAPKVNRWRSDETLQYVKRIEKNYSTIAKKNGFREFLGK